MIKSSSFVLKTRMRFSMSSHLWLDKKIRDMAKELDDFELLYRICWSDLVTIGGKYGIGCLAKFRNSSSSLKRKEETIPEDSLNEAMNKSRAFVELKTYIDKSINEGKLLFKLSRLHSMYEARLRALEIPKQIMCQAFMKDVVTARSKSVHDNIKRTNLILFKRSTKKK